MTTASTPNKPKPNGTRFVLILVGVAVIAALVAHRYRVFDPEAERVRNLTTTTLPR